MILLQGASIGFKEYVEPMSLANVIWYLMYDIYFNIYSKKSQEFQCMNYSFPRVFPILEMLCMADIQFQGGKNGQCSLCNSMVQRFNYSSLFNKLGIGGLPLDTSNFDHIISYQ